MLLARLYLISHLKLIGVFLGGLLVVDMTFRFVKFLSMAAENRIAGEDVWNLLALKCAVGLSELLPLAVFLGTFAVVVGLRRTNEFVAMLAGGYSATRMLRSTLAVGVFAGLAVAAITLYFEPEAETRIFEIRNKSKDEAEIAGVRPGVFKPVQDGRGVFYAERLSDTEQYLERAFVESTRDGDALVSKSSRAFIDTDPITGERVAVFEDGMNYRGVPGRADYAMTSFARYAVVIERKPVTSPRLHENYRPTRELLALPTAANRAEFQWRLALPLATCIMPVIAFAIALRTSPQDWHLSLVLAVALYFLYVNLLGIGRSWLKDGDAPAVLGLWWVHAAMLGPALSILYLELRPRPVLRRQLRSLLPSPLR